MHTLSHALSAAMATRSQSSQRWLKEHFSDPYVKKAQAEGMRSRAAYKLEELAERDRLLKPGMVVVDLGAAPGGWSQWVRQELNRLDPSRPGRVIASDILEMPGLAGVDFLHGDFSTVDDRRGQAEIWLAARCRSVCKNFQRARHHRARHMPRPGIGRVEQQFRIELRHPPHRRQHRAIDLITGI